MVSTNFLPKEPVPPGNQYGFVIKHYSVTCLFIYVFPWIGIVYHVLKFSNGFLLLGSE